MFSLIMFMYAYYNNASHTRTALRYIGDVEVQTVMERLRRRIADLEREVTLEDLRNADADTRAALRAKLEQMVIKYAKKFAYMHHFQLCG